jgi:hypothetical protein
MQTVGHKASNEFRFEDALSARNRMPLVSARELDGGDVRRAASPWESDDERACRQGRSSYQIYYIKQVRWKHLHPNAVSPVFFKNGLLNVLLLKSLRNTP